MTHGNLVYYFAILLNSPNQRKSSARKNCKIIKFLSYNANYYLMLLVKLLLYQKYYYSYNHCKMKSYTNGTGIQFGTRQVERGGEYHPHLFIKYISSTIYNELCSQRR